MLNLTEPMLVQSVHAEYLAVGADAVEVREGRKREVRRMLAAVGTPVLELRRIALGTVALGALPAGEGAAPFRVVLLYPDCRGRKAWKVPADVLVIFGGRDDVAPPGYCRDALAGAAAPERVATHTYAPALHAFDVDELPERASHPAGTIGYHKESARAAWIEIERFLKAGRAR